MIVLTLIRESIIFAYKALIVNKLRALLSLLSITIGIFAIIFVFTLVDSLENGVRTSVASLGDDVIFIEKWPWTTEEGETEYPWWRYWQRPEPSLKDLRELEQREPEGALAMCYMADSRRKIDYKSKSLTNVSIQAVSSGYDRVKTLNLSQGRVISETEHKTAKNVAIIGYDIATSLFGGPECIGRMIKIGGFRTQVIGVFAKEGSSMIGNSLDNVVTVPATFARNFSNLDEAQARIMVKAKPGIANEELIDELIGSMRAIHRVRPKEDNNFSLNQSSLINKQLDGLFGVINLAGLVIGGFSIVVGGFSIANIMFVSVKERTSLIGIQKSLGAKNYFILLQFLFEAIFLCLIGGALGILLVAFITFVINMVADAGILVSLKNVLIGIATSIVIGLISGVIPAYFASRLDPVEAIRSN
ncbi:MAG: ABC transporter permease [Bacteroidota bacterium]